jgi:hypothetical protein
MKKRDPSDWQDAKDIVAELIERFSGHEAAIGFLLMSLGNTTKHLCTKISEEEFDKIMESDQIFAMGCYYSEKFMKAGDILLKKYGSRK